MLQTAATFGLHNPSYSDYTLETSAVTVSPIESPPKSSPRFYMEICPSDWLAEFKERQDGIEFCATWRNQCRPLKVWGRKRFA